MIACARVGVDTESSANRAFSVSDAPLHLRFNTTLFVQHALGLRDDDLRPALFGGQRLFERGLHFFQIVGLHRLRPLYADAFDSSFDGMTCAACRVFSLGRQDVLATRCSGVTVVDDDCQVVALIEYGVTDTTG